MFRTSLPSLSYRLLRSSDVKRFKSRVSLFYSLSNSDVCLLFPFSNLFLVQWIHSTGPLCLYVNSDAGNEKECAREKNQLVVFMEVGGKSLPTVNTMWKVRCVKVMMVNMGVSKFILNGADLMLQGCDENSEALQKEHCFVGSIVAVVPRENPFAIAIGELLVDYEYIAKNGLKGKGVKILHYFSDSLSSLSSEVPNEYFKFLPVPQVDPLPNFMNHVLIEQNNAHDLPKNNESLSLASGSDSVDWKQKSDTELFIFASKISLIELPKESLPIDSSVFNLIVRSKLQTYGGPAVDVKSTTFKKLGSFMEYMCKAEWIEVKMVCFFL